MVFSSVPFIFAFMPVTLIVCYLLRNNALQNIWLLMVSLLFYAWGGPSFLPVMLASILINYTGGIVLSVARAERVRRACLWVFLLGNLTLLGYWKYFSFLASEIERLMHIPLYIDPIVLPIGISFFTFQGMSYLIDCYRRETAVQKNPLKVALYIAMFPQLVAGPIVRYSEVNRQIDNRHCTIGQAAYGLRRFSIGLGKKVIIANSLAQTTDEIFALPPEENLPAVAWLGAVTYLLQLYHDFSGYSDMAIGLGHLLGFHFPENFRYPLTARSVTDYWRRWHMSLGGWFRDYVYIPMGGSRQGAGKTYRNILFVWILTGIWHGANWTFLVWALIFCSFILLERTMRFPENPGILAHGYVLLVALIAQVIFNSPSVSHGFRYVASMFGLLKTAGAGFDLCWYLNRYTVFMILVAAVGATPAAANAWHRVKKHLPGMSGAIAADISAAGILAVSMMYVMTSTYNPFIYFQF